MVAAMVVRITCERRSEAKTAPRRKLEREQRASVASSVCEKRVKVLNSNAKLRNHLSEEQFRR